MVHLGSELPSSARAKPAARLSRWRSWPGSRIGDVPDLSATQAELLDREDIDDDEVAAVAYALGSVLGHVRDAWWTSTRATDAAYLRIPAPINHVRTTDLEQETASPHVQEELAWQRGVLEVLEGTAQLQQAIDQLRT